MPCAPKMGATEEREGEICSTLIRQVAISEARYRPKTMIKLLEEINSCIYFGHYITCET
jgi:hypothetical protein